MREFCFKHQLLREAGQECVQCAVEARAIARQQIYVLNVLEARIADLEAEVIDLRRALNETRQITLDVQGAHNRAACLAAGIG